MLNSAQDIKNLKIIQTQDMGTNAAHCQGHGSPTTKSPDEMEINHNTPRKKLTPSPANG